MITIGLVTDIHSGPNGWFEGKLRKLSERAPELGAAFVARMREIQPDLVVNLGDVIEDESEEQDLLRYRATAELLSGAPGRLVSVAGNHDRVNLDAATLRRCWGLAPDGPLYRSFDVGEAHFVILYTHERKDCDVQIDQAQLQWLAQDLAQAALPTVVLMHHSAAEMDLRGNRWFEGAPDICLLAPEQRRELRALLQQQGRVVAVFNGHLHWNHLFVDQGLPYVTVQSLTENVAEDAPGVPAAAFAVARLGPGWLQVDVAGAQPARYELSWRA